MVDESLVKIYIEMQDLLIQKLQLQDALISHFLAKEGLFFSMSTTYLVLTSPGAKNSF